MTATVWRHIIEMKMNQCLIIQIEAYWFENLEVQVIAILCGQQPRCQGKNSDELGEPGMDVCP